jgi:hypothetical protein
MISTLGGIGYIVTPPSRVSRWMSERRFRDPSLNPDVSSARRVGRHAPFAVNASLDLAGGRRLASSGGTRPKRVRFWFWWNVPIEPLCDPPSDV